jgi:hypothetical protein
MAIITEKIKQVLTDTVFIVLVTVGPDQRAHPIVLGKGEIDGDTIRFGIYTMVQTQLNLRMDSSAWLAAATMDGSPSGYRISGTAYVADDKLVFIAEKAESLM